MGRRKKGSEPVSLLTATQIAEVCHEANRVYCASIGDHSHVFWKDVGKAIQDTSIRGVEAVLTKRKLGAAEIHARWCADKDMEGWVYGTPKDIARKIHPNLVPFAELPHEQRLKTLMFRAIVIALASE